MKQRKTRKMTIPEASAIVRRVEILEDQEDLAILKDWLERRKNSKVEMISLEDLEQELSAY